MTTQSHLSDDRLIEACYDGACEADDAHLRSCPSCRRRHEVLAGTLHEVTALARAEADAAFDDERLARQQARILQRVARLGRPARVIAFPAPYAQDAAAGRSRVRTRWAGVAAAVAASFVVGLLAEHLTHDVPGRRQAAPAPAPAAPSVATFSEDEFLGQIEIAATRTSPIALEPLHVLTPRAWDVR